MKKGFGVTLFAVLFLVGMLSPITIVEPKSQFDYSPEGNDFANIPYGSTNFKLAEDPVTGYTDPVDIKHSRYEESETVRAGTSSGTSNKMNVTLDEANGWFASQTEVEVSNIRNLYALNGTFDEGVDPWVSSMYNPNSQVGSTTYNSTYEHVTVSNTGAYDPTPTDRYAHYQDTYVYWTQTIVNSPLATNFSLNFDYLYESGPMDGTVQEIWNEAYLAVFIDSTMESDPLVLFREVPERNTWYAESKSIYLPSAPASFVLKIGLFIDDTTSYVVGEDYDDDGQADELIDLQKIEVWLDNIEFKGVEAPDFEEIDMRFHAGSLNASITGTSDGSAIIMNPSFWTSNPLQVEITANTSAIFDYKVTSLLHQYTNSTWGPDPLKSGVKYMVAPGESADLTLYTYVPVSFLNLNMTIDIEHPLDWTNVTVFDSLLTNVTSVCDLSQGLITIPGSLMDSVGWWEIRLESPNYAKNLTVQKYDLGTDQWLDDSVFRSGNKTRAHVTLGTQTSIPPQGSPVNISWIMPNGTIWKDEQIVSMINGELNGTSLTLGGLNTTVGKWDLYILWTNGSEIAFDGITFELHHKSTLIPVADLIETTSGTIITNMVYFQDTENNQYIMEETASVVANWSGSTITFDPNPIHNRWEGDFNTTLLGAGTYTVIVNASDAYHDDASVSFEVHVIVTDNDLSLASTTAEINLKTNHTANFTFEDRYGIGIESASINVSYTGPTDGILYFEREDLGLGSYRMNFFANISGSYAITLTAWKSYYEQAEDTLFLLVGEYGSQLSSPNGTSAAISYGDTYRFVLQYENTSSYGLTGADVSIVNIVPSSGLTNGSIIDEGSGFYSVQLTPQQTGVFTLLFEATLLNHETQLFSFTLISSVIGTQLAVDASAELVAVGVPLYVTLNFTNEMGEGIENANISIVDPPDGLTIPPYVEIDDGLYKYTITPTAGGAYQLRFRANKSNHIDATASYSFLVGLYTSVLTSHNGTSGSIALGHSYNLAFKLANETGYGLSGAYVDILSISPASGLNNDSITDHGNGNYTIAFTSTSTGIYTIEIEVSLAQHETQLLFFTLTSPVIATQLSLEASSGLVVVGDHLYITLNYTNDQGVGIENANVSVIEPPAGLSIYPMVELGSGLYWYNVTPTSGGAYQLRFEANKTNYLNATAAFSFLVGLYTSVLASQNGSSGSIGYNQQFNLVLEFTNSTGYGLSDAVIDINSIIPSVGLNIDDVIDNLDGTYSILLTPSSTGIYTLEIEVAKLKYETQIISFTISCPVLGSLLTLEASSEIVAIGDNCSIIFTYSNETSDGISGATITVLTPPAGLVFTDVEELGNGVYRVNVTTTEVNEYQLRFKASALNHLNATAAITLSVTLVPTSLIIEEPLSEYSTEFGSSLEVSVHYLELNYFGEIIGNISGATFEVSALDETGLNVLILPREGHYAIFLSGDTVGIWELTISANRTGYSSRDIHLDFIVYSVETGINEIPSFVCYLGRTYSYSFYYTYSNGSGIEGVTPTATGRGNDWMATVEIGDGVYNVTFTPIDEGSYIVYFDFSKSGHQLQSSELSFEVEPVPIAIISDRTQWNQSDTLRITVTVVEDDTRALVNNATVYCELFYNGVSLDEWQLVDNGNGVYSGSSEVGWPGQGNITVLISAEKSNFKATHSPLIVDSQPLEPLAYFTTFVLPPLLIFLALGVTAAISIQFARKRKAKIKQELQEIKSTFDDANNLLGILVLHKDSGLPVYSMILKGGFEEGMLSAFVTAVTHFRSEFETNGAETDWKLTPISDIIRAGPTKNLICAFVTMMSPSLVHEAKMLMFTKEIGLLLDDSMESPPTEFRNDATGRLIESMFDDRLDGNLLKKYRIPMEGAMPRKYRCILEARSVAGLGDSFSLSELSRGLEACGFEEAAGLKLLYNAVQDGQLWSIERNEDASLPESSS